MQTSEDMQHPVGRDRVREHTSPGVNARIDRQTRTQLEQYLGRSPEEVGRRLAELEREWDVDRALMANFALAAALSSGLAVSSVYRRGRLSPWLLLLGAQLGFLLLHAVVGWCPPVVLFRRLGFRTQKEIDAEHCALVQALGERDRSAATHS